MTALAEVTHEDPAKVRPIYSGAALLTYYTNALDSTLQKDDKAVEDKLGKIPFAHIPVNIEEYAHVFAETGTEVAHLVVSIDNNINQVNMMLSQYRLAEIILLEDTILGELSQAYDNLEVLENTAQVMGNRLEATSNTAGQSLKNSYLDVLDRIAEIRQLLDSYKNFLTGVLRILEQEDVLRDVLTPTTIILDVNPAATFVGDVINFQGELVSTTGPLAERQVDILLDGDTSVSVITEVDSSYRGTIQLPYKYVEQVNLQALYYPRKNDIGHYLPSLSSVITVNVLFYRARLELNTTGKSYPGRETAITGKFIYSDANPPIERKIEVYLDDTLNTTAIAGENFNQKIMIPALIEMGEHVLTIAALPTGRYAPVIQSIPLQITRAVPVIDIDSPGIIFLPGITEVSGKVYSELAPLEDTTVRIRFGSAHTEVQTTANGLFQAKIKTGLGLGLFGTQALIAEVSPQEPWYNAGSINRDIQAVNVINCSVILAIFIYLSILVRRRMAKRGKTRSRTEKIIVVPPAISSRHNTVLPENSAVVENDKTPGNRLWVGYRLVVRLIINSTGSAFHSHQTLREFSREAAPILGPVAVFFDHLTSMVEKLLYSGRGITETEADEGKQLTTQIEQRFK